MKPLTVVLLLFCYSLIAPPPPFPPEGCILRAQFYESPANYDVAAGIVCQVSVLRDGDYTTMAYNGSRDGVTVSGVLTPHVYIDAPGAEYIAVYSGAPELTYLPLLYLHPQDQVGRP